MIVGVRDACFMVEKRLPNAALHGHVEGKRRRGRHRKTWMDNPREDLKEKNIDLSRIGEATRNREVWRDLVRASSSTRWWKRENILKYSIVGLLSTQC